MTGPSTVDAWLAASTHPRLGEIRRLRAAILAAEPEMEESVKWNAPNFRFAGVDRVTFRVAPKDQVQLILHRGAKVRDTDGFAFDDPEGHVRWLAPDRGVVTFADMADTAAREADVGALVQRWVRS